MSPLGRIRHSHVIMTRRASVTYFLPSQDHTSVELPEPDKNEKNEKKSSEPNMVCPFVVPD